jgi:hypothetical protein
LTWPASFRDNWGLASVSRTNPSTTGIDVPCTTLDALYPSSHITLLKLDVEDHESYVLNGAQSLLADKRIDHILYECHDGTDSDLHSKLREYGYIPFGIEVTMRGPKLLPINDRPLPSSVSTSFLASKHPTNAKQAIVPNGWMCLSGSNGHQGTERTAPFPDLA